MREENKELSKILNDGELGDLCTLLSTVTELLVCDGLAMRLEWGKQNLEHRDKGGSDAAQDGALHVQSASPTPS
jgi:hypothetical protein